MLSFTNIVFMTKHLPLPIQFNQEREITEQLCKPLSVEDYATQIDWFASPPKWHLAHTTWFFESFVLEKFYTSYRPFDEQFAFLFNSYYISKGNRLSQSDRGSLAHPSIDRIYEYRRYVNRHIIELLESSDSEIEKLIILGLNHEQQHQELLLADIKYNFGSSPLLPTYIEKSFKFDSKINPQEFIAIDEGVYDIGHNDDSFCFDNEMGFHKQYLQSAEISKRLVTNREYAGFIADGGYNNAMLWLSDGWKWVKENNITKPLYWERREKGWNYFTLHGLRKLDQSAPVSHISYYEANAFARWAGYRLPTEFEWETASKVHHKADKSQNLLESENFLAIPKELDNTGVIGNLWEWTESAYLPYHGYKQDKGSLGEYNGKFMINQMVLRGGSYATPLLHIRNTYRNFYYPNMRWMFSGIRLAKSYD